MQTRMGDQSTDPSARCSRRAAPWLPGRSRSPCRRRVGDRPQRAGPTHRKVPSQLHAPPGLLYRLARTRSPYAPHATDTGRPPDSARLTGWQDKPAATQSERSFSFFPIAVVRLRGRRSRFSGTSIPTLGGARTVPELYSILIFAARTTFRYRPISDLTIAPN